MSITYLMNGQVGASAPEEEPREKDWLSPNGTIGYYYSPDGEPVPEWRARLADKLLPTAMLLLRNGSDMAGVGIARHDKNGEPRWYVLHMASVSEHYAGPWPNATTAEEDNLGWVDWGAIDDPYMKSYPTRTAAEKAAMARHKEINAYGKTKPYKRAMGLGRKENAPEVPYLGVLKMWSDEQHTHMDVGGPARPFFAKEDRWAHLNDNI